jgi:hypothetical protein
LKKFSQIILKWVVVLDLTTIFNAIPTFLLKHKTASTAKEPTKLNVAALLLQKRPELRATLELSSMKTVMWDNELETMGFPKYPHNMA